MDLTPGGELVTATSGLGDLRNVVALPVFRGWRRVTEMLAVRWHARGDVRGEEAKASKERRLRDALEAGSTLEPPMTGSVYCEPPPAVQDNRRP